MIRKTSKPSLKHEKGDVRLSGRPGAEGPGELRENERDRDRSTGRESQKSELFSPSPVLPRDPHPLPYVPNLLLCPQLLSPPPPPFVSALASYRFSSPLCLPLGSLAWGGGAAGELGLGLSIPLPSELSFWDAPWPLKVKGGSFIYSQPCSHCAGPFIIFYN